MNLTQTKSKAIALGMAALLVVSLSPVKVAAAAPAPHHMRAAQGSNLDFDLVNKTGYKLKKVLINASSTDGWDEDDDVLKGQMLEDGETLHISFSPKASAAHWDMKVVYNIDGSSHEWDNLNLNNISKITLHYDADANSTHADIE